MDVSKKVYLRNEISSDSEFDEETSSTMEKSTNEGGGGPSNSAGSGSNDHIARNESKAVNRSKWIVYLVILLAAAGMGTAAYKFTAATDEESFQNEVSNCPRKHKKTEIFVTA
jgi:hypothetical protein